ncbi:hypothetical protein [Ralstonia solanacearum]|uniref:hypothetical protein n=1 Tax=Ralstonia solanacearum TaxID=305 RepID=UPI00078BE244|nr:hypothetical protein [Ralstonia solanacearum]AMP36926.1 hypothetical protein LBM2029_04935 [Ralstonia solanacearum]AXV85735.1 hypothetical protein CJO78_05140 [Ralstonia solanacearum]AXW05242.1 hypothetical protein CJO82_04915 [Ralstonia solanacearum]AXW22986.1 hypothetical protein CJO86_04940 [Ralstonia solanacearum]AXW79933.1 hypothetical protein CJO98_05160 [Ralstonia solanacearum]
MYSESDIDGAVEAGVLSSEAAQALRNHVAALRAAPAVDEESFRLLTGFKHAGLVMQGWALTALVIGSALLSLSAFWLPLRRRLVTMLGPLGERLPPVQV